MEYVHNPNGTITVNAGLCKHFTPEKFREYVRQDIAKKTGRNPATIKVAINSWQSVSGN